MEPLEAYKIVEKFISNSVSLQQERKPLSEAMKVVLESISFATANRLPEGDIPHEPDSSA